MTKFILHGGAINLPLEGNEKFFREAIPDIDRKIKILVVYFARKIEEYPSKFKQDMDGFVINSPQKKLELEIADLDPEKFRQQIKWADVIYVRGGNTAPLVEKLKEISDFKDLIKDKVYAGESAGMYAVSKYYYSNGRKQIEEGLGILPIKALAHWEPGMEGILQQLEAFGEKLPIYKLPEADYIIIEQ